MTEFENKTIAVVGLARSGLACCRVLTALGAQVTPWDSKPANQMADALAELSVLGLTAITGGEPLDYSQLDYVVTSPGVRKDAAVLQDAVKAGVPVLGEIEAAYRVARAPILAITGTNGKTTTTLLLGEMLQAAGIETYIAGNIAAGDIALPLIQAAFDAPPEAAIVAEISSFQLEWISTFRPKVAALLNISPDHGDRQTWGEYVAAKWRIFEFQDEDDFAVLHHKLGRVDEDIEGYIIPKRGFGPEYVKVDAETYLFGSGKPKEIGVWNTSKRIILYNGPSAIYEVEDICLVSEVKLLGKHNLENICAAATMASMMEGVKSVHLHQVATTFTGVVHRLEYVETIDGVKYVNNSMCTNADAFAKSLEALPEPKVVIAGGVFKGGTLETVADAVVRNNVKALVLIGRSAPEIENAARAAGYENVHRAETLADAVATAASLAVPGETVLLAPACASFDMFADFEDRGEQFKAAVRSRNPSRSSLAPSPVREGR